MDPWLTIQTLRYQVYFPGMTMTQVDWVTYLKVESSYQCFRIYPNILFIYLHVPLFYQVNFNESSKIFSPNWPLGQIESISVNVDLCVVVDVLSVPSVSNQKQEGGILLMEEHYTNLSKLRIDFKGNIFWYCCSFLHTLND